MSIKAKFQGVAVALGLLMASSMVDVALEAGVFISDAEARIGRPLTPASVAGVARRTTRRVIRRTAVTVAALPSGCSTIVIEGTTLHQCGATYYQPSGSQYVVVKIE